MIMLEKIKVIELVSVTETNNVEVREATRILEDGKILSRSYKRWVLEKGDDISSQDDKVQAICNTVWK